MTDQPSWRRLVPPSVRKIRADVDDEIRFHLEMRAAELERQGMDREAAWNEAVRRFGDHGGVRSALIETDQRRERAARRREWLGEFLHDITFGWRQLRAQPGFALTAIATLGIGIGSATAIFSAADHALLRPLPYEQPEHVVAIRELRAGRELDVSPGNFVEWKRRTNSFSHFGLAEPWSKDLTGDGSPMALTCWAVTLEFLPALGVRPMLGRLFLPEDFTPDGNGAVILSHGVWTRRFASDSSLVNRSIRLDGAAVPVVGILPPGVDYPEPVDAWSPKVLRPEEGTLRTSQYMYAAARLKPGVTMAQARDDMNRAAGALAAEFPATNATLGVYLASLDERIRGPIRQPVSVLLVAVGFLLLIACTNVAMLLLARGADREGELGLRTALGAGRGRLVTQLFTESALLAGLGGLLGIAIAWAGTGALSRMIPAELGQIGSISVDGRILVFALAVTLGAAFLFGLAPALRLSRPSLVGTLAGARSASGGADRGALRRSLIAAEVALALVLLAGAGLLGRSFLSLLSNDLGFEPEAKAAVQMFIWDRNPTAADRIVRAAALEERLGRVPGVEDVALTTALPFHPHQITAGSRFMVEGQPPVEGAEPRAFTTVVTPGYHRLMGIPLIRGRWFTDDDRAGGATVALINQTTARRFFPDQDPIGKRVLFGVMGPPMMREIVGVVGDVRPLGMDSEPRAEVFVPYVQSGAGSITFVARTTNDPATMLPALSAAVWDVDPEQTVYHASPVTALIAETLAARRFNLTLIAAFAVIAAMLSAVGVHGLITFTTARRRREIGVRLALGAERRDVLGLIVRQGIAVTVPGIMAGLLGAFLLTRFLAGMLYRVKPLDPMTFVGVAVVMLAVAVTAAYLPARKASRVDPVRALREG